MRPKAQKGISTIRLLAVLHEARCARISICTKRLRRYLAQDISKLLTAALIGRLQVLATE